jgi:Tfp pilus tip-associated adhesin PilY1
MLNFTQFLDEAAKGHTIEAHGIKGMKGTPWRKTFKSHDHLNDWAEKNDSVQVHGTRDLEQAKKPANEELDQQFDMIEDFVMELAEKHQVDAEVIWEDFDSVEDEELYEAAVDAKGHKSSTGGLTQKGRDYYNNKYGGNLKAPVTTKPSKLKAGSKAANRRKSFCARMSGVDGPMKDEKGRPTRKAASLKRWNCK